MFIIGINIFAQNDGLFNNLRRAQRRVNAHTIKAAVAEFDESTRVPAQGSNGDQEQYPDLRGNFGKSLAHLDTGFINQSSYLSMVRALQSGLNSDFNVITLGTGSVKLVNPQASLAFSLEGNDSWINFIPPAPRFTSDQAAGEMVELYWTVTLRDVPFNDFDTNANAAAAIADLNSLTDFFGPKINGMVTDQTLLRGNAPGELVGPYISQFLYLTIPYGSTTISPNQTVPVPGSTNNFITSLNDWFTVINGGLTGDAITYDPTQHFIRTPRDLSEYVHKDTPGQAIRNAALILNSFGANALDRSNPYLGNPTQVGFATYGIGYILSLVQYAAEDGLKGAWYQKWQVNRRLRPEEFGFYIQQQIVNGTSLNIASQLIDSPILPQIFSEYGTYLLPQAYPEGCPSHPSYPSGHAVFTGAGVTILKAYFDETFEIPSPVEPNAGNSALVAYAGTPLTIGGELNKLASNIALGRDHAGIHYRSDGWYGMLLGEAIAIDILNNESFLNNENFGGYTLTKFDGTTITVGAKKTVLRS